MFDFLKPKTLPTPHTAWNFENNLIVLQTILCTVKKAYIEENAKWNQSYEFIKQLKDNLLIENIDSSIFEIHSKDSLETIGFVLDCSGAFWSYKGINGIEKILQYQNRSLKGSYFLTEVREHHTPQKNEPIFIDLDLEKTRIVAITPIENIDFETPIKILYSPSSNFLHYIERPIELKSDTKKFDLIIDFSNLVKTTPLTYSKYKHLIKNFKFAIIEYCFFVGLNKKIVASINEDLKNIKHLFKGEDTHAFLIKMEDSFYNLHPNLSTLKNQLIFLNHMGRGLELEIKDFGNPDDSDEISEALDINKYCFRDISILFLNMMAKKQPQNLFYTCENWNEKIKQEYGSNNCVERIQINEKPYQIKGVFSFEKNELIQEIPKIEQNYISKQSMYNKE